MRSELFSRGLVLSCMLAAVVAAGCGRTDRDASTAAGDSAAAVTAEGTPVTLTGCLQKHDRLIDSYVLSDVRDEEAVGTSGAERTAPAAARAYRIVGADRDDLEHNLGKQVRVTGRLRDERSPVGTGGELAPEPRSDTQRDVDDLPSVKAESITAVADACGTSGAGSPSQPKSKY
jgi:hypothetical protein